MNRPGINITDAFKNGSIRMKNPRAQRVANCLQWRQLYRGCDRYSLTLDDGGDLEIEQIDNGEMKGIGTGAVVWPAAHVLAKYMELRFTGGSLSGKRVIDIGSGTGCTGLVAGIMGANVTLTDQDAVRCLLQSNIDNCCEKFGIDCNKLRYQEYEWEQSASHLNPPFDLVLVSDCVLPKLYPIEPLVKAVSAVMGGDSVALFSYEHRIYPTFDPRHEFRRIAAVYNLEVRTIPLQQHHPYYCSDDIEIWEVRRNREWPDSAEKYTQSCCSNESGGSLQVLQWGDTLPQVEFQYSLRKTVPGHDTAPLQQRVFAVKQDVGDGRIGATLWASSVVLSRFLLSHPTTTMLKGLLAGSLSNSCAGEGDETRHLAIDIGAGCGLTSMALRLCGYDVVASDKAFVLDTLMHNVQSIAAQADVIGDVDVCEFNWQSAFRMTSEELKGVFRCSSRAPAVVVLSDCFYQSDAVLPLLHVLNEISSPETLVVVANEIRSALDEFIRAARKNSPLENSDGELSGETLATPVPFIWNFEEVLLCEEDGVIYTGAGGHLSQRPTRLFLSYRSSRQRLHCL